MKLDPKAFKGLSRFLAPSAGGPVADRALAEGLIGPDQLQECVTEQDKTGKALDEILVARGLLKAEDVLRLRHPAQPPEVAEASADPSRILGQYVLVSFLGSGGMAEVWKGWDRSLGRWVALKFLKAGIGHSGQRIEREGRMAAGLSHPNIVPIYERGEHQGRAYLVMPLVEGSPIRPPLPAREAARIAYEAACALDHAHQRGVIHRDVKPANLLIDSSGRVLLADFGLALMAEAGTSRWAVSGTPEYASPEQIRGDGLDTRTDIYSLGVTLYHLLSGRPPFSGRTPDEIGERVLKGGAAPIPGVPPQLHRLMAKAMERDRARRPASMAAVAADLEAFLKGGAPKAVSKRALAAAIVVGILPWVVTGIVIWRSDPSRQQRALLAPLAEGERELLRAEQQRGDAQAGPRDYEASTSKAMEAFERALGLGGGALPEASLGMGRCLELLGRGEAAEAAFRAAVPLPAAHLGLARAALRRHFEGRRDLDWRARALPDLERARDSRVGDPAPALLAFAKGDWEKALAETAGCGDRNRNDDVLWMAAALSALELGRWTEARLCLEPALRLRREDAVARYWMGVILTGLGERDSAINAFSEALRVAPAGWPQEADARKRLAALRQ